MTPAEGVRWRRPFAPTDPAALAVFRIAFGLVLFYELVGMILSGEGRALYRDPSFRFPYYVYWSTDSLSAARRSEGLW